jgi:hypothetical protein
MGASFQKFAVELSREVKGERSKRSRHTQGPEGGGVATDPRKGATHTQRGPEGAATKRP